MQSGAEKVYSETFIIWNENVNFVGTLKPSGEGTAEICGSIKFKNGKQLSFSSPPEDCDELRNRFMLLCRRIADFYGTDAIYKKFLLTELLGEAIGLLRKTHLSLN